MQFVVAVAEERSFTRAANRCNVTQPALSRRVQEVEEALGIRLFERQTRRVTVTPAGKLFVREARRALEQKRAHGFSRPCVCKAAGATVGAWAVAVGRPTPVALIDRDLPTILS